MNNDLISRNALKDRLKELLKTEPSSIYGCGLRLAIENIDNAPTVKYPFYQEAYQTGYEEGKNEKPTINCKDCDGYEAGYSAGLKDAERTQVFDNCDMNVFEPEKYMKGGAEE